MAIVSVITDANEWRATLARVGTLDFYYTYDYHRIARNNDGEVPTLIVYEDGSDFAIYPYLRRSVPGSNAKDGVSVYGYCGPMTNAPERAPEVAMALLGALKEERVVTVFSRLHPLIDNEPLARHIGDVRRFGTTVSIDLQQSDDEQRAIYRGSTRREIRKLRNSGVTCYHDKSLEHLDTFVRTYEKTMARVGATDGYYFNSTYFQRLLNSSEFDMRLYVCLAQSRAICGGLFSFHNGLVQYHLSGTDPEWYRVAPNKLMLDTVRADATVESMSRMHLGGGLGGREDSLFRFKAGFSPARHSAATLRVIVDPDQYTALCAESGQSPDNDFFPAYRAPATITGDQSK